MKRRKLIRYGILSSAVFCANTTLFRQNVSNATTLTLGKERYDWVFLHWMPYDNDLSSSGKEIISMAANSGQHNNLLIVFESDFKDRHNIARILIKGGRIYTEEVDRTNSADEESFSNYLDWAQSNFEAEKWCITILGHSGSLDQVSPDDHPSQGQEKRQWMNIKKLSERIAQFNQKINGKVELFFFQNCNKGTLEAHYTVYPVASYTLSSQKVLGEPNFYYESLFQFLDRNPKASGDQVAVKISEYESPEMFISN